MSLTMNIRQERSYGLTLVELIAVLAITAILMVAVATSTGAFCQSFAIDQGSATGLQTGSLALTKISNSIRTCTSFAVDENITNVAANTAYNSRSALHIVPLTGPEQAYRFQSYQSRKQLRFYADATAAYTTPSNIAANSVLVVDNVTGSFSGVTNAAKNFVSLQVSMTVAGGSGATAYSIPLSTSVVARRIVSLY